MVRVDDDLARKGDRSARMADSASPARALNDFMVSSQKPFSGSLSGKPLLGHPAMVENVRESGNLYRLQS